VSRWLAGVFDPSGREDGARVAGALAPHPSRVLFEDGPLRLAYTGAPPRSADVVCLLDGHLDNQAEIRAALQATWPGDPGASPEELLAAGYRAWGRGLLERMRGDFVLLIWDRARSEGLVARDQLGVRPFFVCDTAGPLRFAGEVRHLLALLPRRPPPDDAGVAHWVAVSNRPGPQTLYAGIRRLEPGGVLMLDRRGARAERYWEPRFQEPLELDSGELEAQTRAALALAVRRRSDPEGLTGVLMSGGLDSSSVAALCGAQPDTRVHCCSATFPEHPDVDESELIHDLRRSLELPGLNAEVHPGGLLASALESLAEWQMPLLGWGDFWTLPLMRTAAAQGADVMLDGEGGDELFGPRSYLLADSLRAGHPREALALAYRLPGASSRPPRRAVARMVGSLALAGALPYRLHDAARRPLEAREAPRWLRRGAVRDLVRSDDPLAWKRLPGPRWWSNAAHGLTRGIEEAGVFEHHRRRAALAGLEARHPLLDLDLVELGLRHPPRATLDPRFTRPILRGCMAGLLPDTVRLRPAKARFESLLADCLAGPDGAAVRSLLSDPAAELGAYVDLEGVRRDLLDDDRQRRESPFRWMWQVWRLTTAECWLRAQTRPCERILPDGQHASPARVDVLPAGRAYVFPP
jgi:asparagine synthase (glutamine-hydrolysing)